MDENPDALERYSTKLIKYAWRSTWHFSKQQIIFSTIVSLVSAPIAYYFGLAPSILAGVLAVLSVFVVALLGTGAYNFLFHAPAQIYKDQQQVIVALQNRQPVPQQPAPRVPDPDPNVVCMTVHFDQIEIESEHDIVRDGIDHLAVIAEFVNAPHLARPIGSVDMVFAVITYFDQDNHVVCEITHGSWMDEDMREVNFLIGDRRRLVLLMQQADGDDYRPEMDALRAIQNNHESWQRYRAPEYWYLPQNTRRIEVRLCSAGEGATIGTYRFHLEMGEDPMVRLLGDPA